MDPEIVSKFILWAIAFLFSATCHEAAHALVAKIGGDTTAYLGGQVSLNPFPHMKREPVGMIVMPIITFFMMGQNWMMGWASAPYDPYWANRHPHRAALMALAGPASNLLLALGALLLLRIGLAMNLFQPEYRWFLTGEAGTIWVPLAQLCSIFLTLNVVLFTFNLIPLPPLDGATGILIFFKESYADRIQEKIHSLGMFGLLIAWLVYWRIGGFFVDFFWRIVYYGHAIL